MYTIYTLGTIACSVCLFSNVIKLLLPDKLFDYDDYNSPIYTSLRSDGYIYNLLLGCGICIQIFLEIFIDFTAVKSSRSKSNSKSDNIHTILQLGLVLCSLFVVDLVILMWIIPFGYAEYFGSISATRTILCFTATFAHLKNNGGEVFRGRIITLFAGFGFLCPCLKAYSSVIDSIGIRATLFAANSLFGLIVCYLTFRWFVTLWKIPMTEWTSKQLSCSVYQVSLLLSSLCQLIVYGLQYVITPSAGPETLIFNGVTSTISVINISILHGRIARHEVIQAEVIHTSHFSYLLYIIKLSF